MLRLLRSIKNLVRDGIRRALRLDVLSLDNLAPLAANRLRRNQMRGAIDQMQVFVVGNTLFSPALSFQAWNAGINALVIGWTAIMVVFSWWLLYRWRRAYRTDGSARDMQNFVTETKVNASLWCFGFMLFYPLVTGDNKTILTTVMAGSLALGTVGFAQAPRAALWYLGIQTTVLTLYPIFWGLKWGTQSDIVIGLLSFIAGLAILNAVLERARAQINAFTDHEALSQKSEVVDLLLKDYEKQGTEWVWLTGEDGKILSMPQAIRDLVTTQAKADVDYTLYDLFAMHIDEAGLPDLTRLAHAFEKRREFHDVTLPFFCSRKQGLRWIMMRGRPQFERNRFVGFRGIFADNTTTVEAQKQVAFLAEHDPLTGTYNRNLIQTRLTALDPQEDILTAYLIDLDGFKLVNDSYGHPIGDALLQQVAHRLNRAVGINDIVARIGGDEFLVLTECSLEQAETEDGALSAHLLSHLSAPYLLGQFDIAISASIGIAHFPRHTRDGPQVLNQADLALYAAKRSGRNRAVVFEQAMQHGQQKRIIITERLRHAVQHDQISPVYQPQYCAQTHQILGFEALARWTDEELGVVGPDLFIPIAEETGLIQEIGQRLLLRACQDAKTWAAAGDAPAPRVCVNVSPVQVMRGDLVALVHETLAQTGLPPERLEIEVTEGVLIDDMNSTRAVLHELSGLGVRIALDDFGTGYSSLSYLRNLPLHRLKIDRSFVADLDDPEAQSVVQTIIDLCRRLHLTVVAEGVETAEHVRQLSEMQCDILQGYYFAHPLRPQEVQNLLKRQNISAA